MRHGASVLSSLEGMSYQAFCIARELTSNSRSGLTVRFLSKKLDLPEEEVEYLVDVNHGLFFTDLTKIKIVPEGHNAVKRILNGLENRGDVPSLFRLVKAMSAHDFRRLEEQIGIEQPATKKAAAESLLERYYKHPDSLLNYVATRGFSSTARELFDVLWQSKDGMMPVSQLRVAHGGKDFEVENALWELFRGHAAFELFRFDSEDRLVRMAALLHELRQERKQSNQRASRKAKLRAVRGAPDATQSQGLGFSDTVCRLVASAAARPVRLRGDGELFREDRRRLSEICSEDDEPSLSTCLWAAEGVGWMVRVENTLRAGELEALLEMDRLGRHRELVQWLLTHGGQSDTKLLLTEALEGAKLGTWYRVMDVVEMGMQVGATSEQPVLKPMGAHWEYVGAHASGKAERALVRAMEESYFWLGLLDRAELEGESVISLTPLGDTFLRGASAAGLREAYPERKGEFVVQPNFDVVVPVEDMDPLLTVPLDQFAERVSSGKATVYSLSKDSFVQGVQEGHDAKAFVEFLVTHNREPELPPNVRTTLDDWRGGMKRVRMRTIHVIESEDPLVMAELTHRRRFQKYLKGLDGHHVVAYSGIARKDLAKELEKDGFVVD